MIDRQRSVGGVSCQLSVVQDKGRIAGRIPASRRRKSVPGRYGLELVFSTFNEMPAPDLPVCRPVKGWLDEAVNRDDSHGQAPRRVRAVSFEIERSDRCRCSNGR
jgi:hypothetical protein